MNCLTEEESSRIDKALRRMHRVLNNERKFNVEENSGTAIVYDDILEQANQAIKILNHSPGGSE